MILKLAYTGSNAQDLISFSDGLVYEKDSSLFLRQEGSEDTPINSGDILLAPGAHSSKTKNWSVQKLNN